MPGKSRALTEELLALVHKTAADVARMDDLKEELRALALEHGAFTEKVEGAKGGEVAVTGGSEPKLKGLLPVLDPAAFLALPKARREKLIADKIVAMDEQWSRGSKPSVTVRV